MASVHKVSCPSQLVIASLIVMSVSVALIFLLSDFSLMPQGAGLISMETTTLSAYSAVRNSRFPWHCNVISIFWVSRALAMSSIYFFMDLNQNGSKKKKSFGPGTIKMMDYGQFCM